MHDALGLQILDRVEQAAKHLFHFALAKEGQPSDPLASSYQLLQTLVVEGKRHKLCGAEVYVHLKVRQAGRNGALTVYSISITCGERCASC